MKKIPNLIITSGDPAGIGLDLCVMLAFKNFWLISQLLEIKMPFFQELNNRKKHYFFKEIGLTFRKWGIKNNQSRL